MNYGSEPPFPFDADLTDCLLMTLPDFQSLQSFISTSKFVYAVFRGRQRSILRAVAHSQFGLTLPLAMCLAGYRDGDHELQREVDFSQEFTLTPMQVRLLRDHAATVRGLEDVYSWRRKDPRSRSSRLSAAESLRFQQSMYRFWLLTAACRPGAMVDERHEYNHENRLQLQNSIVAKQTAFLLSLEEAELVGVNEVHGFLLDLARWALVKHTTIRTWSRLIFGSGDNICLVWSGPAVTLDAFRGERSTFLPIASQQYNMWRAMSRTFSAAEIVSITVGRARLTMRQPGHFILDNRFLEAIECNQCRSSSGMDSLWSACNWEYMILTITPSFLTSLLPVDKRKSLYSLVSFAEATESITYPQFIEEIFDIRSEQYKDWKKEDWLCAQCMIKLLSDHIQLWFDTRAVKSSVSRSSVS